MKTLREFSYNGEAALLEILRESSYLGLAQTIASLSLFTHPKTVEITQGKGLFRIRRYRAGERRGTILEDEKVVLCDNDSPTRAFLWANRLSRQEYSEVQFNHIYPLSNEPAYYTSLANLCVTPAFLSKLTDKNEQVKSLLRFRAYDLYRFVPDGHSTPAKPDGYGQMTWAETGEVCSDLKSVIEGRLAANRKSRIALSVDNFGWLLG